MTAFAKHPAVALPRFNLLWIPFGVFALLGLACLGIEGYNQYFREISSPFLAPGLGFLLLSLFFLIKHRKAYFVLSVLTLTYVAASLTLGLWGDFRRGSVVQCYRQWSFDTKTGRLLLKMPLGRAAPTSGAYVTCSFTLRSWWDYLDNQPNLCTGFDEGLRVLMFLNDQEVDSGVLREFQINQFQLQGKSLLGEPLDRGALRLALLRAGGRLRPTFQVKAIYQVYERVLGEGQSRVIESFTRDGQGNLKSFTESSALNLTTKDIYAVYNQQGILSEIPRLNTRTFAFPARIDVAPVLKYTLPPLLYPGVAL
ncbi:MAG: hypothetical protein U1F66_03500 [bacterium]